MGCVALLEPRTGDDVPPRQGRVLADPVHGPPAENNLSEGTSTVVAANGDELLLEHTMLSQMVFGDAGPVGFTFVGTWEAEEELKPLVGARRALARPRPHPGPNRFAMSVGRGRVRSVRTPVRLA